MIFNKLRRFIVFILIEKIGVFLSVISPKLNTIYSYYLFNRKFINLNNPKMFAEKLSWLKLNVYNYSPLVKKCSDKLTVREYLKEQGLGNLLNDLYGVYIKPDDIDFEKLPQSFVLKWNFGMGFNFVCEDKYKADLSYIIKQLNVWGNKKFWLYFSEMQYNIEEKRIICERFLDIENSGLIDYKLYCFHGFVKAILVMQKINSKTETAVFMTPEWEIISGAEKKYKRMSIPKKPLSLKEMIDAANVLSTPFPFVRVDFYEWHGKAIFGEMTFTPAAGVIPSEAIIDGKSMGDMIDLKDFM